MTNNELIIKLTSLWTDLVRLDHHKDRDCHWTIEIKYSYGQPPEYNVLHYGYIADEVDRTCSSLDEAEKYLIECLFNSFEKELDWAKEQFNDTSITLSSFDFKKAESVLDICDEVGEIFKKEWT